MSDRTLSAVAGGTGTKIPVDAIHRFDQCMDTYMGRGLPPCQNCPKEVQSVCEKIKSALENGYALNVVASPEKNLE